MKLGVINRTASFFGGVWDLSARDTVNIFKTPPKE